MLLKGRKYLCFISSLLLLMAMGGQVLAEVDTDDASVGLDTVVVEDKPGDGSAEAGYKVDKVKNFGFWGEKSQLDMPYSMFIISEELIENVMANNSDVLTRMLPWTGIEMNTQGNIHNLGARGFGMNSVYLEGVRLGNTSGVHLDDKAGAEILSGFGGFMFGMGTGPTMNYNLKRSTREYLNKVTVTGRYIGAGKVHADFGGPLPFLNNKFGYRFNVSYQDGETERKNQYDRLFFISQTFDFKPTNKLDFLLNFSYAYRKFENILGNFGTTTAALGLPDPLSGRYTWGVEESYNEYKDFNATWGMNWEVTDWLQVRAGYNYRHNETEYLRPGAISFVTDASGTFYDRLSMNQTTAQAPGFNTHSYGLYSTAKAETFGLKHTVTLGSNGYRLNTLYGVFRNPITGTESTASQALGTTYFFPYGDWKSINDFSLRQFNLWRNYTGSRRKTSVQENYNIMIGDEIKITDQWTIFAGINRSAIKAKNYNLAGVTTSKYDDSAWTPTFSVMYKPIPNATFYATYIEALEQGTTVAAGYDNAGEVLKPMKSEQYEAGIKYEIPNGALLSLALFQIDKALAYSPAGLNQGTLGYDGRQVHTGIEVGVQGRLWNHLTLMGGFTYLDPQIKKTNNATILGKEPMGTPNWIAKTYAELDIPWVDGLVLTGGAYYNGSAWCDSANTYSYPGYVIVDLGTRYKTNIYGVGTTFRLNVGNITNTKNWTYARSATARSVVLSVSTSF